MADHPQSEAPPNGTLAVPSGISSKRQRRPSVRLGEIGEQPASAIPFESYIRRCKQYNFPLPAFPRPHADDPDAPRKVKPRRSTGGAKRPRSNWASRVTEDGVAEVAKAEDEEAEVGNCSEDDLRWGDSGSPMREQSVSDRVGVRVRGVKEAEEPSEMNGGRGWWRDDHDGVVAARGVRSWLDGLGLARYAPVFDIHEVDTDVLPMLTLDDLKEMGINAVGTRRKMFSSILKLRKGSD